MIQPYILLIVGHSCSGKSTLVKKLQSILPGSYHIGFDKIKWWLSGYDREKDIALVRSLLYGFIEVILKQQLVSIVDIFFRNAEAYAELSTLAESHDYRVISIELHCPEEIRLERFRERVNKAREEKSTQISVTDEWVFLKNMKKPMYFPANSIVFDTSVQSTEEIIKSILTVLET